jgi:hypothetical protein
MEDVRRITAASTLPLVDIDTGFGGALMIGRTIREMTRRARLECISRTRLSPNAMASSGKSGREGR